MSLSYSQMSTFEKCPRLWRYQYVEKRFPPKGEALKFGEDVHAILADMCLARSAGTEPSRTPTFSYSRDRVGTERLATSLAGKAFQVVDNQLHLDLSAVGLGISCAIEKKILLPEFDFVGIIDLLAWSQQGQLYVLDWKTTSEEYHAHDIKASDQLTAYAWLVEKTYHYVPDFLAYVTLNKQTGQVTTLTSSRTKRDIIEWEEKVNFLRKEIGMGVSRKTPTACITKYGAKEYLCSFYQDCWGSRRCSVVVDQTSTNIGDTAREEDF